MSAVGVILLMAATSIAVVGFFRKRTAPEENTWQRAIAPTLAAIVLLALVVLLIANFDSLGTEPNSPLRWLFPAVVLAAGVIGLTWGAVLRRSRPDVYAGIGRATTGFAEEEAAETEGLDLSGLR